MMNRYGEISPASLIRLHDKDKVLWRQEEIFSVLTLVLLLKSIRLYVISNPDMPDEEYWDYIEILGIRDDEEVSVRTAAQAAVVAMECINHAERLRRERKVIEEEDRQRSELAQKLNGARHAKRDKAKDLVLKEWLIDTSKFSSAAKAGNHYASWLSQQGMKSFEPTTVIKWIRDCAKKEKIRLR